MTHEWQEFNAFGNTCHHPGCTLTEDEHLSADEPAWVERTLADVRTGDTVRLAGVQAYVVGADQSTWHVRNGGSGWWDDVAHDHREMLVTIRQDGGRERTLRFHDLSIAVEIRLSRAELAAIELLGWSNRLRVTTDVELDN